MKEIYESDPNELFRDRPVLRPTARTWIKHILLLVVTFCTATIAGSMFPFGRYDTFPASDPQTLGELLQFILTIPEHYAALIAGAVLNLYDKPAELAYGLSFSLSLLFILL